MIGNSNLSQFEDVNQSTSQSKQDSKENITSNSKQNYIKSSSHLQITDLNNKTPLIKLSNSNVNTDNDSINNLSVIDGNIYQTNWTKLVGTELVFDDYGELIGSVREHLKCDENIKVTSKNEKDKKDTEMADDDGEVKVKDEQTSFLLKAIKSAKKKEAEVEV